MKEKMISKNRKMIFSVSTIKDNKDNIEFFIRENRLSGIDYMFIFYEGELMVKPEEYEFVTFIPSLEYNSNIASLNLRQKLNIRRVVDLLCKNYRDHWIVNLDGDEVVNFRKGCLDSIDEDIKVVKLSTLEPINDGRSDLREQTLFKTTLNTSELKVASLFDLIESESNAHWLSGHSSGKYIARISPYLSYNIHHVSKVPAKEVFSSNEFNVIHYESISFEEFLRKFKAHAANHAGFKKFRSKIVAFFRNYQDSPSFIKLAKRIYEENFIEHNIELKKSLGFIFEIDRIHNTYYCMNNLAGLECSIPKDSLVLPDKYVEIIRPCATQLEILGNHTDAYSLYNLAKYCRPWGSFINGKVTELDAKLQKGLLRNDDKFVKGAYSFSAEQKKILVSIKRRVDLLDMTDLSDSISYLLNKYS